MVSGALQKFKWKKDNLATCRCFACGDSKKNRSKTRGYFFENKGKYVYKCHNCGIACNLYSVLESVSPSLCKEYAFENFKDKNPEPIEREETVVRQPMFTNLGTRLDLLDPTHKAVKYVKSREIPEEKYCNFYYCSDFSRIMADFDREGTKEDRLVIPFYDEDGSLLGVQGRSFEEKRDSIRYITLKKDGEERLWYNLDKVDPRETVYVTEGPIDSMFLPNAIAMAGSDGVRVIEGLAGANKSNIVFVYDNEPRNKDICRIMDKVIEMGYNVAFWPDHIEYKDINDMVIGGLKPADIKLIIDNNTYADLQAKMKMVTWRKS
jgi:hypothetical protein